MFSDNSFRATSTAGNRLREMLICHKRLFTELLRHVEKGTHSEGFKKGTEQHTEVKSQRGQDSTTPVHVMSNTMLHERLQFTLRNCIC